MKLIYYAFSTKEIVFKSKNERNYFQEQKQKKLFSRAKTKEKDKKTGILKNAALKIICFSF